MPRKIEIKNLKVIESWVDASYATHMDRRSHTGATLTFSGATIAFKSSKQKMNTKSSTEAELVGASDYVTWNIWVARFLKEQGIVVKKNILYQDNQSGIKLEMNGRSSSSERTRHIHKYFFYV